MRKIIITIISFIFVVLFCGLIFYLGYKYQNQKEATTKINITETSLEKSINKIYDATVTIQTYLNDQVIGIGSGFIYKKDDEKGYIITNYHVVENANTINIINSNDEIVTATLLGYDLNFDIAVLSIPQTKVIKIATLGNSNKLKLGDSVIAIGTPSDLIYRNTVTKGIISAIDRYVILNQDETNLMKVIQTDCAINPGNSGGPLININGEVIGIISLKLGDENKIEGISFAIPISDIEKYLDKLEKKEPIIKANLNINVVNLTDSNTINKLGLTSDGQIDVGVMIIENPINIKDLKKGNIIIAVNNIEIKNVNHFKYIISKYDVNEEVSIRYYDGKNINNITIKLS